MQGMGGSREAPVEALFLPLSENPLFHYICQRAASRDDGEFPEEAGLHPALAADDEDDQFHLVSRVLLPDIDHEVPVIVYNVADDEVKTFLAYSSENKGEIWRFLTYVLLHANAVHLVLNVVIQGLLGTPLEVEQGPLRCAAVYFGGGLAGSLGASAFATFSSMVGASGGVYALLISQIPNVVLNYETIKYAAYRIVTVAALTASDVIYIFCHVYFFNNEKPHIGWVAHASGAAAGLLLGFLLFNGTSKWKNKFRVTSCVILAVPLVLAIVFSLAPSTLRFLTG